MFLDDLTGFGASLWNPNSGIIEKTIPLQSKRLQQISFSFDILDGYGVITEVRILDDACIDYLAQGNTWGVQVIPHI